MDLDDSLDMKKMDLKKIGLKKMSRNKRSVFDTIDTESRKWKILMTYRIENMKKALLVTVVVKGLKSLT